ncbi:hypothetical protein Zmor_027517 [Zophobas morio]|uniref:Uncharacterized protein n=1 Tax=Zophobas morio TaxID=2755281 RepID=A0AA38M2L8_9CUCU|nr:hypothetical protein Zmor_027517 [Zophobas morio]
MKRKRIIFGWMKLTESVGYFGKEGETIEHMLEGCEGLRESEESREEVLNEDGRGLKWMKEVRETRELRQGMGKQKE